MRVSKATEKVLFKTGLELLESWAMSKNWLIEYEYLASDEMDPASKIISINTRQGIENQLYTLLHECGHVLVQQDHKAYAKRYPGTAKVNMSEKLSRRLEKSVAYKIDVISEEIEAWQRGLRLAKRLGIYINEEKYTALMNKCVYSYVKWAAGSPGYGRK